MKTFSTFLQFIFGVALALALIGAGGVAAALYLAARHSSQPSRPVFEEERVATQPATNDAKTDSKTPSKPAASPSVAPTPKATATAKPQEPGLYKARVTWAEGLSLRERPGFDSKSVGGIEYNGRIVVLEETPDKEWQRIRIENNNQEGWIKSGNIERLNSPSDRNTPDSQT